MPGAQIQSGICLGCHACLHAFINTKSMLQADYQATHQCFMRRIGRQAIIQREMRVAPERERACHTG